MGEPQSHHGGETQARDGDELRLGVNVRERLRERMCVHECACACARMGVCACNVRNTCEHGGRTCFQTVFKQNHFFTAAQH